MGRKVKDFTKDMLVYQRYQWGPKVGQVNENVLYKIRRIGPKEATVIYVEKDTMREHQKGGVVRLDTLEHKTRMTIYEREHPTSSKGLYPVVWGELFVVQGQEGWDAADNY